MTQRSEHGAFVRPAFVLEDGQPVDTSIARNVLANNALHALDCSSRVLVNDVINVGILPSGLDPTTFKPVGLWGPFPLSTMPDGSLRPVVARIFAGRSSGADTAIWRVALHPYRSWPSGFGDAYEVTSGDRDWIAPPKLLRLDASRAQPMVLRAPYIHGGGDHNVGVSLAVLTVSAKSATSSPMLYAVYAREFAA
jgi:hypothetical protein